MTWAHDVPSETAISVIGVEIQKLLDTILPHTTELSIRGWVLPESSITVLFRSFVKSTDIYENHAHGIQSQSLETNPYPKLHK